MKTKMEKMAWSMMLCSAAIMGNVLTSCSDSNESVEDTVRYDGTTAYSNQIIFNGNEIGNGTQEFVFTGDVTLDKGTYLLKGWVYVAEGAKLHIPAGTVIKGDKQTKAALIIEPGGYAEIKGTQSAPVVFTSEEAAGSRKPGDWGGLIICGKARNNQTTMQIEGGPRTKHGGNDDADNSGIYQYIRVEFAGYPFKADQEINGVTLGSVGSGTVIDHIQVSYSNDDSFEWFGGAVSCKYLVAYKGWDDDFDTDNGFSGTVQYGLAVRDPKIADTSLSNGFESDNNAAGTESTPFTSATFKNFTFIGPRVAADFSNTSSYITAGDMNPNNGSKLGQFQSAMQIRRSSKLNVENTLAVGFPVGLIIDGEKGNTPEYAANGGLTLKNLVFAKMQVLGADANKAFADQTSGTYKDLRVVWDADKKATYTDGVESFSSTFFKNEANAYATSVNNVVNESVALSDPASVGTAYCPTSTLSDKSGGYIGAFKSTSDADNWLKGWTNFDPQHTNY